MEAQTALHGGRVAAGVVRVGETVRKPQTLNSDFVRRLLSHLREAGFTGAPRAFVQDELGRDTLEFIAGDVPTDLSFHEDPVLSAAAGLIRRYHDATACLVATAAARRAGLEVICHNDLSPCIFVFSGGLPIAIIDFDAASPRTRVRDLGYATWLWLDLGVPEIPASEQARRLSVILTAYGPCGASRRQIVEAMLARQTIAVARGRQTGDAPMSGWAEGCRVWTVKHRTILEDGS